MCLTKTNWQKTSVAVDLHKQPASVSQTIRSAAIYITDTVSLPNKCCQCTWGIPRAAKVVILFQF